MIMIANKSKGIKKLIKGYMTEQLCCYCSFAVVNLSFPILEIKSSTDIAGDDDDDDMIVVWFGLVLL